MEPSSLVTSRTPPLRAVSEGPTPPPRRSMEDADSSLKRKRPRLDSGDTAYRSMSAEPSSTTLASPDLKKPLTSSQTGQPANDPASGLGSPTVETQRLNTTPSKMTINVRESDNKDDSLTTQHTEQEVLVNNGQSAKRETTAESAGSADEPILLVQDAEPSTPSPVGSPEIEVAEPEEMSGHVGPTIWHKPGKPAESLELQHRRLLLTFPLAREASNLAHCFQKVHEVLQRGSLGDGELLLSIARWLDQWLLKADQNPSSTYELYCCGLDFWGDFPRVFDGIVKRSPAVPVPHFFSKHEAEDFTDTPVGQLLSSFVAVCARLLQMDRQTLLETIDDTNVDPDLGARQMIAQCAVLLTGETSNQLYRLLQRGGWQIEEITFPLVQQFTSFPHKGLDVLSACVALLLERVPFDWDTLCELLDCACSLASHAGNKHQGGEQQGRQLSAQLHDLFKTCNDKLRSMIEKQVSFLTHEILKQSISLLSNLYKKILKNDRFILEEAFPEDLKDHPVGLDSATCPPAQRATLSELAWKFDLLLKCITAGRMDSRMTGVEEMQTNLLNIHGEYIKPEHGSLDNVVVQYAANFLLDKKVIDYLVGVDSHPRLLSESRNIIAFLAVTHKFTKKEVDMIWASMLSSQDPRIADAILQALRSLMEHCEASIISYLLQKLMELPVQTLDSKMANFIYCAVECRWNKCREGAPLDPAMFQVLIRILRECPSGAAMSLSNKIEWYHFAASKLRCLPVLELSSAIRTDMLRQIIGDISEVSSASTGSIVTLSILWDGSSEGIEDATRELGTPHDFAALIVKDFTRLRETEQLLGMSTQDFPPLLQDRLYLIQKLIVECSSLLTTEQMVCTWTNLVGQDALDNTARDRAWSMLTNGAKQARGQRNSFFDKCVEQLLPKLDPKFLTPVVLEFASQLTTYEDHLGQTGSNDEDALPGDMFWHIALKVIAQDTGYRASAAFVDRNIAHNGSMSKEDLSQRHVKLVERCIRSLTAAAAELRRMSSGSASSDEDSMVIIPSESDVNTVKQRFIRSLSILKLFLQQIRDKQPASPASATGSVASEHSISGNEISIRYQPHVSGKPTGVFTVKIGDMAPLRDLLSRLSSQTGFSQFSVIAAGQRIDQTAQADVPICDIKGLHQGMLLIQKVPGSRSSKGNGAFIPLLPLEQKVMNHFQELYDLLCINEELGCEVYNFLVNFPPHDGILAIASDETREASDSFPVSCPYKALYSVFALKRCLTQRLQEGAPCEGLLKTGVLKLADVLISLELSKDSELSSLQSKLHGSLVDCMLRFLKEPVSEATASSYFKHPTALIDRFCELLQLAERGTDCEDRFLLIYSCFAASLEACLKSPPMWEYFKETATSSPILQDLWLQCKLSKVRGATTQAVRAICTTAPENNKIGAKDFIFFFWTQVVSVVSEAVRYGDQAEQFFQIAIELFRKIDDAEAQKLPLSTYLETWTQCLLNHEHEEFVGQPSVNVVVRGLAQLLDWCLQLLKARKAPLQIPSNVLSNLFMSHVFPSITLRDESELIKARVPVLDSQTRALLYSLLYSLIVDESSYHNLIKLLKQLIPAAPERTYGWMAGIAQVSEDYNYEPTFNFDRSRAIRSSTGYAGLKNLSNTCYLNSLLMQLFMNINFRSFILNLELVEDDEANKLLVELKKLFAYLQETWLKSVDPENVVSNIVTFEGLPIDVNVQMDVDEFYNLLFDRLEGQMPTENDRRNFRSFYGGQLVQQIKSQDCEHISERFEPFSVVQCDIQGKMTLAESLGAFIEGEMMQGDNKYKCSTCDKYVNAIKRACLKDVPDNLIFHLKRFDYDLMNGTRSKVNDYFDFPQDIDMSPYNVEYLKDTQQAPTPDRFVLVGVLVHQGNAEAGHYYSYIRERPGLRHAWVEMNDADVTPFDPMCIRDQCFGGVVDQPYAGVHYPKNWNAYMLFYQRVSSMEAEEKKFPLVNVSTPVRSSVPLEFSNRLNSENEQWIRKFCLFDSEYAAFVRRVVEHYYRNRTDQCSEGHRLERDLIQLILHQIEMVFARAKDCHLERDSILDCLYKMSERCCQCGELILRELTRSDRTLRALILRCPDESFRQKVQNLLFNSLRSIKERNLRAYSPELEAHGGDSPTGQDRQPRAILEEGLFRATVRSLSHLLPMMHQHSRMWDEYYALLIKMASMGRWEKSVICSAGYLLLALQLAVGESRPDIGQSWHFVELYLKAKNRRRISFKNLVALMTLLFEGASDFSAASDEEDANIDDPWAYDITTDEWELAMHMSPVPDRSPNRVLTFLLGVIGATNIDISALQDLVRTLVRNESLGKDLVRQICNTVLRGTAVEPAALATPYLFAGLAFCETCTEVQLVRHVLTRFSKEVASISDSGGAEHLEFFVTASKLYNSAICHRNPQFFYYETLKLAPSFAPHLLFYVEREVRMETVAFLKELIFERDPGDDEYMADALERAARGLLDGCLRLGAETIRTRRTLDLTRVNDFNSVARHLFQKHFSEESDDYDVLSQQIFNMTRTMISLAVSSPEEALSQDFDSEDAMTDTSNVD